METPSQSLVRTISPPASPYRGVLPFRLMDQNIFFGREIQQQQIFRLICIYRGTLLYGDSGSGKSSLINAGLIPLLIREGFEVERLRLHPKTDEEIVLERIPLTGEQHALALPSLFSRDTHTRASERPTLSLAEFNDHLTRHRQSEAPVRVLIFDQFEELVTQFEDNKTTKASYDQAKAIQQIIVSNLHDLLTRDRPGIKILLAFREDYLGRLAQLFPNLPQLKDQSLRLTSPPLDALPAIISGPFQVKGLTFRRSLQPGTEAHLQNGFTAHSTNGLINLTEVQIACASVWEDSAENTRFLEEKDPRTAVQSIFDNYVPRTVTTKLPAVFHPIAYNALNRLVTPGGPTGIGTRNIVSENNLKHSLEKDGHSGPGIETTLQALRDDARLIFRQNRGATPFYEIVSEFLVKGITTKLPGVEKARADHEAALLQSAVDQQTVELRGKNLRLKLVAALVLVLGLIVFLQYKETDEINGKLEVTNKDLASQFRLTLEANQAAEKARSDERAADKARQDSQEAERIQKERDQLAQSERDKQEMATVKAELNALKLITNDAATTAGIDKVILKFDTPLLYRLTGPSQPVRAAAYSPDGRYIALGSEDKKLRVYSRFGGKTLAEGLASGSLGGINALAFSPSGSFLLTGSAGGSLRLFDPRLSNLGQGKNLPVNLNTVNFIGFSPDGNLSVATDDDGEAALLDWSAYPKQIPLKPLATLKHESRVTYADFSADGDRLVTSSDDGRIRVFAMGGSYRLLDVQRNGQRQNPLFIDPGTTLLSQRTPARRLRFSPTDPNIIAGGAGNSKLIWYYLSGNRLAKFQDNLHSEAERGPYIHDGAILDIAFSPDGAHLASIGTDGQCLIWDTATAKTTASLSTTLHGRLLAIGWQIIQDKSLLALGGEDGRLELWDMSGTNIPAKPAFQVLAHSGPLLGLRFDPLKEQLLTWDGIPDGYTPKLKANSKAADTWKAWQTDPERSEAAAIPSNQPAGWSLHNALR